MKPRDIDAQFEQIIMSNQVKDSDEYMKLVCDHIAANAGIDLNPAYLSDAMADNWLYFAVLPETLDDYYEDDEDETP